MAIPQPFLRKGWGTRNGGLRVQPNAVND